LQFTILCEDEAWKRIKINETFLVFFKVHEVLNEKERKRTLIVGKDDRKCVFFLTQFDGWIHFVLIFDLYLWEDNPFMFQQLILFQFKRH